MYKPCAIIRNRLQPMSGPHFDEFKGDIEAAERQIAREIDPGARALVLAIAVFVLLVTLLLPHAGGARGFDVLVGSDAAVDNAIALRATRGRGGRVRLRTEQDPERPIS